MYIVSNKACDYHIISYAQFTHFFLLLDVFSYSVTLQLTNITVQRGSAPCRNIKAAMRVDRYGRRVITLSLFPFQLPQVRQHL
jgi:hypothetical protein